MIETTATSQEAAKRTIDNYINDRDFADRINEVYGVLSNVCENSHGHGITFVLRRDDEPSRLDKHMRNAIPYNGVAHSLYDLDITDVIAQNRKKEMATIVDAEGNIGYAGVHLPADDVEYQESHGIEMRLTEFLGYDVNTEELGSRTISALCASEKFGDSVAIVTLSKTHPGGKKGEISIYFLGDRIYNSAGRPIRWSCATNPPVTRATGNEEIKDGYEDHCRHGENAALEYC